MDVRGFDSSIILNLRGGILRPTGDFLESLSEAMLVGIMLVGRFCVNRGFGDRGVRATRKMSPRDARTLA